MQCWPRAAPVFSLRHDLQCTQAQPAVLQRRPHWPCAAAQEFAQRLKSRQPELELSDADLLVLEIAGEARGAALPCSWAWDHSCTHAGMRVMAPRPAVPCCAVLRLRCSAGLCHDLGHGPFSHSFESELVPHLLPQGETW